jgi:hypothetical protein
VDLMQLELVGGGGVRPMSLDDEGGPAFLVYPSACLHDVAVMG